MMVMTMMTMMAMMMDLSCVFKRIESISPFTGRGGHTRLSLSLAIGSGFSEKRGGGSERHDVICDRVVRERGEWGGGGEGGESMT